jgi:hypothetical protein
MKTTKQMASVITRIAQQAEMDLDRVGAHIRLDNPPYMALSIEVIGKNLVSVAHYYEQNGDLVPDPDAVFFTGYELESGWVPVSVQMAIGTYHQASWVDDGEITRFDLREQAEQAAFANMWARNLQEQGFAKCAQAAEESTIS